MEKAGAVARHPVAASVACLNLKTATKIQKSVGCSSIWMPTILALTRTVFIGEQIVLSGSSYALGACSICHFDKIQVTTHCS